MQKTQEITTPSTNPAFYCRDFASKRVLKCTSAIVVASASQKIGSGKSPGGSAGLAASIASIAISIPCCIRMIGPVLIYRVILRLSAANDHLPGPGRPPANRDELVRLAPADRGFIGPALAQGCRPSSKAQLSNSLHSV